MWKDYIEAISKEYHFTEAATNAQMALIKQKLNVELPLNLLELFNETNGIFDKHNSPLIWSIEQIVEDNLFYRNFEDYEDCYMPFDNLLFFSDAGNGDLFCYSILKSGKIENDDIYVWNHEDDSRTWVAESLKSFIEGWMTDKISI